MARQIFKLSLEEKDFLNKIVCTSGIDQVIVKEVLQAILKMITIETYWENEELVIPYICSLKLSSFEKIKKEGVETEVELKAKPSKHLISEIKSINEGDITPTQNLTRQKIFKEIEDTLEL